MHDVQRSEIVILGTDGGRHAARYLMHRLANTVHALSLQLAMKTPEAIAADPALVAAELAVEKVRGVIDELRDVAEQEQTPQTAACAPRSG